MEDSKLPRGKFEHFFGISRCIEVMRCRIYATVAKRKGFRDIALKDSRRSSANIRPSVLSGTAIVNGRPERGSSSTPSFPSLKRLNHSDAHFLLTASTLYPMGLSHRFCLI